MPQLMTRDQFAQLYNYLEGPMGCNFEDALDEPDGMTWDCDETLLSGPIRVDSTVAARYNEHTGSRLNEERHCLLLLVLHG